MNHAKTITESLVRLARLGASVTIKQWETPGITLDVTATVNDWSLNQLVPMTDQDLNAILDRFAEQFEAAGGSKRSALRPFTREELEARFSWEFRVIDGEGIIKLRECGQFGLRFVDYGLGMDRAALLDGYECRPPWSGEGPVPEWRACGVPE